MKSEKEQFIEELAEGLENYQREILKGILSENKRKLRLFSGRPHLRERDNHPTEQLEDSSLRGDLRNEQS